MSQQPPLQQQVQQQLQQQQQQQQQRPHHQHHPAPPAPQPPVNPGHGLTKVASNASLDRVITTAKMVALQSK